MRTKTSHAVTEAQCLAIVAALVAHSQWFTVEPQPDDVWAITVKEENATLLGRLINETDRALGA